MVAGPDHTLVVAELGWKRGDYSFTTGEIGDPVPPRVSVLDRTGRAVARVHDDEITRPHGLVSSPNGAIYVAQLGTGTVTTLVFHGHR